MVCLFLNQSESGAQPAKIPIFEIVNRRITRLDQKRKSNSTSTTSFTDQHNGISLFYAKLVEISFSRPSQRIEVSLNGTLDMPLFKLCERIHVNDNQLFT